MLSLEKELESLSSLLDLVDQQVSFCKTFDYTSDLDTFNALHETKIEHVLDLEELFMLDKVQESSSGAVDVLLSESLRSDDELSTGSVEDLRI